MRHNSHRLLCTALAAFLLPIANAELYSPKTAKAFVAEAKKAIVASLKDPDSAKFRGLFLSEGTIGASGNKTLFLCGEINARNSYGGMVGYRRFFYVNPYLIKFDEETEGLDKKLFDSVYGTGCSNPVADVK